MLDARLPDVFCGYPTGFAAHPADPTSQVMTLGAPERRVRTTTVRAFARRQLGWDPADPLSVADWLSFPSQQLLSVTAGPVHHDGVGELTRLRERLAWYPTDLWRYLLAAGWSRLGEEEHLMGRAGHAGDELGLGGDRRPADQGPDGARASCWSGGTRRTRSGSAPRSRGSTSRRR